VEVQVSCRNHCFIVLDVEGHGAWTAGGLSSLLTLPSMILETSTGVLQVAGLCSGRSSPCTQGRRDHKRETRERERERETRVLLAFRHLSWSHHEDQVSEL
jgi:hypothetical protein